LWKIKMKIRSTTACPWDRSNLTGCQNMDSNGLLSSGAEAFQAYSERRAGKSLSDQACKEMDSKAIAPASSEYSKRLSKIAAALGDNINGQPVNYKVYKPKTSTPSPWLTAASASTAA
jgi:putative metalloprotease